MSLMIRNQLEVTLDDLLEETITAKTLSSAESPQLADLAASGENLARSISVSQAFLDQWTKLMAGMSSDDRNDEEKILTEFKVKDKSPARILHEAFKTQTSVEVKIDKLRAGERVEYSPPPARDFAPNVRLPTLDLPVFDGQESNWPAFWAAFENAVHDNKSLTGAQKFTYLIGRLKGTARGLVEGYAISDKNYLSVIELLLKRFGDDERRSAQLQGELFHLTRPSNSPHSLRIFYDNVERICRQLEGMGVDINSNPFLTIAIKEKMPIEAKVQLFDKEMESGRKWTPKEWREAFGRFVQLKEAIGSSTSESSQPKSPQNTVHKVPPKNGEPVRRAFPVIDEEKEFKRADCSLCKKDGHKPIACPEYNTIELRKQRLKEQKRCYICAREGHQARDCLSPYRCPACGEKHHYIICPKPRNKDKPFTGSNNVPLGQNFRNFSPNSSGQNRNFKNFSTGSSGRNQNFKNFSNNITASANSTDPEFTAESKEMVLAAVPDSRISSSDRPTVFLMVAELFIFNHRDPINPIKKPVFFDCGSQPSFITAELAALIGPPRVGKESMSIGGFMGQEKQQTVRFFSPRYSVLLQRQDGGWEPITLNQTPKIIPPVEFIVDSPILAQRSGMNVNWAEPQILLGLREFWKFVISKEEISPGFYKIKTVFGPVFGGELNLRALEQPIISCPVRNEILNETVSKLWNLETIGIKEAELANDNVVIDAFNESIEVRNGRYYVSWPWRPGHPPLPDNFSIAFSRLSSLANRLKNDPFLRNSYQEIINEQLQKGIIEPSERAENGDHFIPHHPVINSKKVRIVYDASAHLKNCPSLNDCLLIGPNLVPEMAAILIRFRAATVAVLGDVEKAFLMVGLKEKDRNVTKFLWLKDPSLPPTPHNIQIFRFKRIAFGIASSPFILASTLQHHLRKETNPVAEKMAKNFYVDNLLLDCASPDEARKMILEAKSIISKAGMKLREFVSSHQDALQGLSPDELLPGDEPKLLGMNWRTKLDQFIFYLPKYDSTKLTRRIILSVIASFFDPLGLFSPIFLQAKLFFQGLWSTKKAWDDELEEERIKEWRELTAKWNEYSIKIPRCTPCEGAISIQLHAFTDAGPNGFSAAIYLRAEFFSQINVNLVFAKSRLRPVKMKKEEDPLTIPKLELLGILTGIRCLKFVKNALGREIDDSHLWSDSQIALSWINSKGPLPTFIGNRVREIRNFSSISFHYINTKENPADLGARGCLPAELSASRLWWEGPAWLSGPENYWPQIFGQFTIPREEKASEEANVVLINVITANIFVQLENYSTWKRLLNNVKFVLIFIVKRLEKSQRAKEKFSWINEMIGLSTYSPKANLIAQNFIIKYVQNELNLKEIIQHYKDDDGLIRLATRLTNSSNPINFKNPIILPRSNWVTRLLIHQSHEKLAHTGVDGTLAHFLSQWWCPRARRLVKSIIKGCPVCLKDKAACFRLPDMPPWPHSRVNPSTPFSHVGLDFLGPTLCKIPPNPENNKAWVLLITCFVTRAVHLEVTTSLEANEFLAAFRRFVARRGTPREVLSDNAAQFVLTKEILTKYSDIEWRMTPPLAPWAGGIYERLVSLVKVAFRRSVGRKVLPLTQLQTLVVEIEAVLNNRPITFVSDEMDAPLALRPIDFLIPKIEPILMEPRVGDADPNFRPSGPENLAYLWASSTQVLNNFWEMWSRDYLLLLRQRTKVQHRHPRIMAKEFPQIGHIVIVEMEEFPRNLWPLGKIISLDASGRSAKIRMGNGRIWGRPVNKLAPLEVMLEERGNEIQEERENEIVPPANASADTVLPSPPLGPQAIDSEPQPIEKGYNLRRTNRPNWAEVLGRENSSPIIQIQSNSPNNKLSKTLKLAQFLQVICFILFFGSINAAPRILVCDEKGIWIFLNPLAEHSLVCCEGICSSRSYKTPYLLPLPPDLLVSGYECHASYSLSGEKLSTQIQCDPVSGCDLIKCYFCIERIMNPQCTPLLSATIAGLLFGFIILILCSFAALIYVFYIHCWRPLSCQRRLSNLKGRFSLPWRRRQRAPTVRWQRARPSDSSITGEESTVQIASTSSERGRINQLRRRETATLPRRQPIEMENLEEEDIIFPFPSHSSTQNAQSPPRRSPLTRVGAALGLGIILCYFILSANASLEILSLSAKTEHCLIDNGATICHFNSVTSLNTLPARQPIDLILKGPHGIFMGTLSFVLEELRLSCNQANLAWLRSIQIENYLVRRCRLAGSCQADTCQKLLPNQSIPELAPKEHIPGNNFCREVEGFWPQGCFLLAKGCLFYRLMATPISPHVYQLVECPTWQFKLKLTLSLQHGNETPINNKIELVPGVTYRWVEANLTILPSPLGLPPMPILGKNFIMNKTHAALAPLFTPALNCPSESAAKLLKCGLELRACKECHEYPRAGVIKCLCEDNNIENLFETDKLPLDIGHSRLYQKKGKIYASVPYTPVNLVIEMDKTRLVSQQIRSICKIQVDRLVGCYNCLTGGRVFQTCSSTFGNVAASISCEDGTDWIAHCSPAGNKSSIILNWDMPVVDTSCMADCGGEKTNFRLNGTLFFLSRKAKTFPPIKEEDGIAEEFEIKIPHLTFLLGESLNSITQKFIAFLAGAGLLAFVYLVAKIIPFGGTATAATVNAIGETIQTRPRARAHYTM
jgi:hypothetical protein